MPHRLFDTVVEIRARIAEEEAELARVMALIAQTKTEFTVGDLVYVPTEGDVKFTITRIESHIGGEKDFMPKFFGTKPKRNGEPGKEQELWKAEHLGGLKKV